jgi:hypothetical protein
MDPSPQQLKPSVKPASVLASRLYRKRKREQPQSIRKRRSLAELEALAAKPCAELTAREKASVRAHRWEIKHKRINIAAGLFDDEAVLQAAELAAAVCVQLEIQAADPIRSAEEPIQPPAAVTSDAESMLTAEPAADVPPDAELIRLADDAEPMEFDARPFEDDEPIHIAKEQALSPAPPMSEAAAAAPVDPAPHVALPKKSVIDRQYALVCENAVPWALYFLLQMLYGLYRSERTQLVLSRGEDTDHLVKRSSNKKQAENRRMVRSVTRAAAASSSSSPPEQVRADYSTGYAGARQASFHRVLAYLGYSTPENLRLKSESHFLDIGSGVGHCAMHACIAAGAAATRIEVVTSRHEEAKWIWRELRHCEPAASLVGIQNRLSLVHGNIVDDQHHQLIDEATHVWMFDPVFNPVTHEELLPLLARGHPRVVVTCLSPYNLNERWRGTGESMRAFQELDCTLKVDTDGGQSFRVYAYRTQDPDS